ncbi:inositol-pentakisphosphate 2-kinase-domain-containing protein [Phaeosphaeriaceae sp. PMI808]|nr:inositol-pentakisphosphate 2-kinase-domain-containing protein [Phaeosphaeriaceae sp. PMI808]
MAKSSSIHGPQIPTRTEVHDCRVSITKHISPVSPDISLVPEPILLSVKDRSAFVRIDSAEARCCLSKSDPTNHQDAPVPDEALICFEYLNQGGANVIFKILQPDSNWDPANAFYFVDAKINSAKAIPIHHQEVTNKVLRVNKGLSKTLQSDEVISGFYNHVQPLFLPGEIKVILCLPFLSTSTVGLPDRDLTAYLMDHEGVLLYPSVMVNLTSKANTIALERNRGSKFQPSERWGILLPDMSPIAGSSITLEVKPKWLTQSPTAPPGAVRCRTCALQVAKPKNTEKYICPLRLVNSSWAPILPWILARVTEQIVGDKQVPTQGQKDQILQIGKYVAAFLTKGDGKVLLQHLRFLQSNLDPHGILFRPKLNNDHTRALFESNLRLAMTLRDCSLYIKVKYSSSGVENFKLDCKLGDLDFKSADKLDDWADKESQLLADEAYTRKIDADFGCIITELRTA